jgi:predicted transposase YdaD
MATQTYPYVSHLRSQGREEGRQEGLAEGLAEGRAEGRSEARAADIVRLLDRRGIGMAAADRERILACRDAEVLDAWLDRVLTISRVSELFAA